MMPGMGGFATCKRPKADPRTHHIPVIMVTALDQPADKVRGLAAGADEFLTKPVDDIALITRIKDLSRLKTLTDEMLMHASTSEQMGVAAEAAANDPRAGAGRIMLVEGHQLSASRIMETLSQEQTVELRADPQRALLTLPDGDYNLLMMSLMDRDGLRLCS